MTKRDFQRIISDILRPIRSQITNMIARGVVSLVDDSLKMQGLQLKLTHNEVEDNIERFQNYGMTSHPRIGAEALTVFLSGDREHAICLAVDDRRYRIKSLKEGEVAIYTDENDQGAGHRIVMRRGRVIDIKCDTLNIQADNDVTLSAKNITLNASSEITENSAAHRINTKDYEAMET